MNRNRLLDVPQNQPRDLLRFNTAGCVDNGKSTLIGRLLFDSGGLPEDVIKKIAARSDASAHQQNLNLAAFTDGLRAERERGITIDASYRYFSRDTRDFIVADSPGHFEFTRNMMTATSHSDVTLLLVDATKGIVEQNRRHAYLASLVGVRSLVILINKMDAVEYSREVFDSLVSEFDELLRKLPHSIATYIPISALRGENVVTRSANMPWYSGDSLLDYLQSISVTKSTKIDDLRFVVQWVDHHAGKHPEVVGNLTSGCLANDDAVVILPSRSKNSIREIRSLQGPLSELTMPSPARLKLTSDIPSLSRGDLIVAPNHSLSLSRTFDAEVCWMDETPLSLDVDYELQIGSRSEKARVSVVNSKVDIGKFEETSVFSPVGNNEIARIEIVTESPIPLDTFEKNPETGRFILTDPRSSRTVAAGVVTSV